MSRAVVLAARGVCVLCVLVLAALVVLDAEAERFTAGLQPEQFRRELAADLLDDYTRVTGIAHNAGDDIGAAKEAIAHGVDVVEIDVREVGGELHASHDIVVPFVAPLVFRGPPLEEAWEAAALRETVLLELKQRGRGHLEQVRAFLAERRDRRVVVQTRHGDSIPVLRRTIPWAQRVLLLYDGEGLERLRQQPGLVSQLDGVSVRESALTSEALAWLEGRGLMTFAWTVNDAERMNELVAAGLDGLITDRLDLMELLGGRRDVRA